MNSNSTPQVIFRGRWGNSADEAPVGKTADELDAVVALSAAAQGLEKLVKGSTWVAIFSGIYTGFSTEGRRRLA